MSLLRALAAIRVTRRRYTHTTGIAFIGRKDRQLTPISRKNSILWFPRNITTMASVGKETAGNKREREENEEPTEKEEEKPHDATKQQKQSSRKRNSEGEMSWEVR